MTPNEGERYREWRLSVAHTNGRLSLENARQQITEHAGGFPLFQTRYAVI